MVYVEVQEPVKAEPVVNLHSVHKDNMSCTYEKNSNRRETLIAIVLLSLVLVVTLHSALHPPNNIRLAASPKTILSSDTRGVVDFFTGRIAEVQNFVDHAEITAILYYAPWDAESQRVAKLMVELSRIFGDDISFATINVWHPSSEFRRFFNEDRYPVFSCQVRGLGEIKYPRESPLSLNYLSRFLFNVLHPLTMLTDAGKQWDQIRFNHAAVVLGLMSYWQDYDALYEAAMRSLANDPLRRIAFVAAHQSDWPVLFGTEPPLKWTLHLWNQTLGFKPFKGDKESMNVEIFLRWIFARSQFVAPWLTPTGVKSSTLLSLLDDGALVVLRLSRQPALSQWPKQYHIFSWIAAQMQSCSSNREDVEAWFLGRNVPAAVSYCVPFQLPESFEFICDTSGDFCPKGVSYDVFKPYCYQADYYNRLVTSCYIKRVSMDESNELASHWENVRCKMERLETHIVPERPEFKFESNPKLWHQSCFEDFSAVNMNFIAIDVNEFPSFGPPGISIYNALNETEYRFHGPLTAENMVAFLENYVYRHGQPYLPDLKAEMSPSPLVTSLSRQSFETNVLLADTDTVVMFHTPWCGFCKAVQHFFFETAEIFAPASPYLKFASIDADRHRLPVHLSADRVPAVVFFQRNQSASSWSHAFRPPTNESASYKYASINQRFDVNSIVHSGRWSTQALIHFILKHCDSKVLEIF